MKNPAILLRPLLTTLAVTALSSTLVAAEPAGRLLLMGDSITKGIRPGVAREQTFGAQLESLVKAEGRNLTVINAGVGSERTDQALARLDGVLKQHQPNLVAIMYGANDSYVDPGKTTTRLSVDQYRKNLVAMIEQIERAGAKAILMTSPRWADDAQPNGLGENSNVRMEPFVEAVRALARERQLPLVDHYAAWSDARKSGTVLRTWTTDGLHPNATGHRVIAEQMLNDLRPLLRNVSPPLSKAP